MEPVDFEAIGTVGASAVAVIALLISLHQAAETRRLRDATQAMLVVVRDAEIEDHHDGSITFHAVMVNGSNAPVDGVALEADWFFATAPVGLGWSAIRNLAFDKSLRFDARTDRAVTAYAVAWS